MPWRNTKDPYWILVSEIMLQQTQVSRVRTKYSEFLKKFPNITMLAKASLGEVLRAWSGLGYNRRARHLHECAKVISAEHGGKFPYDTAKLHALPGIGLSTLGALLAFSFDKDEPMIDTNIRRILTRVFFGTRSDLGETVLRSDLVPSDKTLYLFAKSLIPKGRGREWNYAMLDLGATLCTARNHSEKCPIRELHGPVGGFQYKKPQKKFAGSDRFYRGQILRLLMKSGSITGKRLAKHLGVNEKTARELTLGLAREHLVVLTQGKVTLPR